MDPEELEELLVRTARLTQENNRMLRRMQRAQRVAFFIRLVRIILIVATVVALYYIIQPYVVEFQSFLEGSRNMLEQVRTTTPPSYEAVENFLNNFEDPQVEEVENLGSESEGEQE